MSSKVVLLLFWVGICGGSARADAISGYDLKQCDFQSRCSRLQAATAVFSADRSVIRFTDLKLELFNPAGRLEKRVLRSSGYLDQELDIIVLDSTKDQPGLIFDQGEQKITSL